MTVRPGQSAATLVVQLALPAEDHRSALGGTPPSGSPCRGGTPFLFPFPVRLPAAASSGGARNPNPSSYPGSSYVQAVDSLAAGPNSVQSHPQERQERPESGRPTYVHVDTVSTRGASFRIAALGHPGPDTSKQNSGILHPSKFSNAMNRIFSVTFRCDLVESRRIEQAARSAGMTTSEFVRRAALAADPEKLAEQAQPDPAPTPPRPLRATSAHDLKPFRTPFVHGLEGLGFERVVQHAARHMRMDQCSVALLLTHVADAIADLMAMGQVVRWPGLFVAGPYLYQRQDGRRDVFPRFQAAPPLNRTVAELCRPERSANESLDNHRKRARRRGVQGVQAVMKRVRQSITNQDLRAFRVVESLWREDSTAHAV